MLIIYLKVLTMKKIIDKTNIYNGGEYYYGKG